MKELLEQYKAAKTAADDLASRMYMAFMSTNTVEEKFKLVLEYGDDFLKEESYYCPHVHLNNGEEVALYDDLYIERHQTLTLETIVECIYDDYADIDWDSEDILAQQIAHAGAVVNQDTANAAILRDMLSKGIRSGTFDW